MYCDLDCQINGFVDVQFEGPFSNVIRLVKTFNPPQWQNSLVSLFFRSYFRYSPHPSVGDIGVRLPKFY